MKLIPVEPEYIYITIPAEYICVYHRILAMLADYGEDMLKDCKASCTDRNSNVIECYNMFNAAVAAKKLGNEKLAETLIKYIKAKINQIYQGNDNSTSFVFPIDENGNIKAFVSCGERPVFEINPQDGQLYEHKYHSGFDEHFRLGPEDDEENDSEPVGDSELTVDFTPTYELINGEYRPCADIVVEEGNIEIDVNKTFHQYFFDGVQVLNFNDVAELDVGHHTFTVTIHYNGKVAVKTKILYYAGTN